ncbi:MAG: hypothetical protein OXE99_11925 [Cellvibrionales bacterium]|nr:hypothetical protein [Cellvibrionales bacterium]
MSEDALLENAEESTTQSTTTHPLIEFVNQSPASVGVHDKSTWMSLFDKYHIVEDPVGSPPHVGAVYTAKDAARGSGALSRFWDTFIAPNQIAFDVKQDIVKGNQVMRDLNINIQMSDKVKVSVPMHLLYDLRETQNGLRIARLAAHWAFMPMVMQLMGKGLAALPVIMNLSAHLLKYQGLVGTIGYSGAAFNVGKSGRKTVETLVESLNERSLSEVVRCFAHDEVAVEGLTDETLYPSIMLEKMAFTTLIVHKTIVAGDTVTFSVSTDTGEKGVMLAELNSKSKKINGLRFYLSD